MSLEELRNAMQEARQMGEAHGLLEAAKLVANSCDLYIEIGAVETARVLHRLSGELAKLGQERVPERAREIAAKREKSTQ